MTQDRSKKPLCIDLYCGRFGWGRAFAQEGWRVIGFDIEHLPYHGPVPDGCELVLQDVLTLHGSQFRDAACIVASPPCQAYSYMAMPWKRAKELAAWRRADVERIYDLNELFDACFRIQREAIAATRKPCDQCEGEGIVQTKPAGHSHYDDLPEYCPCPFCGRRGYTERYIPLIVENVKGAQPWVGPARAHFGSYYLWGDVDSVGGRIVAGGLRFGQTLKAGRGRMKCKVDCSPMRFSDRIAATPEEAHAMHFRLPTKNGGGSWFNVAHNTESGHGQNPDGRKVPGIKHRGSGPVWFDNGIAHLPSSSPRRKAASAQIAEIPFELARYIARCFYPQPEADCWTPATASPAAVQDRRARQSSPGDPV